MPKVLLRFYNIFVSIMCNSWMSASAFAQFSPGFALTSAILLPLLSASCDVGHRWL